MHNGLPPVQISQGEWVTALRMKSWLPEHRRGTATITLAGLTLPRQTGTTLTGSMRVLCLAPTEWLILAHDSSTELRAQHQALLSQHGLALTDWSEALATFVIEGCAARALLSKGCGLDLHPRFFPEGRSGRTRFAQLPVILYCAGASIFELLVERSYSNYLYTWLIDAAAEWEPTRPS